MGLLDTILNAGGGSSVRQLASNFGIPDSQAGSALAQLVPALAGGVKKNVASEGGLESLLGALQGGNHQRFLDQPEELAREDTVKEGNGILGHLFGSKDVSRQVAQRASEKTGLGVDLLKKMLPAAAGMFMGSLKKESSDAGLLSVLTGAKSAPPPESQGLLGRLLDRDGDGSIADDLLGLAGRLF